MKKLIQLCCLLFCLFPILSHAFTLTAEEAMKVGIKIWNNECAGKIEGLTSWNEGESFASLGIGHFTWLPAYQKSAHGQSFPALLKYMKQKGVKIPIWLDMPEFAYCPWNTKEEFELAQNSPLMNNLRYFMLQTIPVQAEYLVGRLNRLMRRIETKVPAQKRLYIHWQFERLAQTPGGLFAMIDYVNFKGEGLGAPPKRYLYGWGLLQVLEQMHDAPSEYAPLRAFIWAADVVLTRRVLTSPPNRHEERWLPGWRNRIYRYRGQVSTIYKRPDRIEGQIRI